MDLTYSPIAVTDTVTVVLTVFSVLRLMWFHVELAGVVTPQSVADTSGGLTEPFLKYGLESVLEFQLVQDVIVGLPHGPGCSVVNHPCSGSVTVKVLSSKHLNHSDTIKKTQEYLVNEWPKKGKCNIYPEFLFKMVTVCC